MAFWNPLEPRQGLTRRNKIRRKKNRRRQRQLQFETLEDRRVLAAANLLITEFMASNANNLLDGDGNASDWIEIHNPTGSAVDLADYYLTDNQSQPQKWAFPSVNLAADGYFVVFASAPEDGGGGALDSYVDAGGKLHTNFKLSSAGEYLGLTYEDPSTQTASIVYEFSPSYPEQETDISYGSSMDNATYTYVESGSPVSYHVPTNGSLGTTWTGNGFNDSSWTNSTSDAGSSVLITELSVGSTDWIEIQNVTNHSIDTSGWRVAFNDPSNGDNINHTEPFLWDFADPLNANQILSVDENTNSLGSITWGNTGGPGWVLIIDNAGEVRDFVIWGYSEAEIATFSTTVGGVALTAADLPWSGVAITGNNGLQQILKRSGSSDSNTASDFAFGNLDSKGSSNAGLTLPFPTPTAGPTTLGIGYDTNQNLVNRAPAGTVSQSSTANSDGPEKAINGNYNDFTHTESGVNTPSYWQVELDHTYVLEEITLYNRTDCCGSRLRDITVEIFTPGQVAPVFTSQLLNPENALSSPNTLELDLISLNNGSPVIGRTVRITRTPDPDNSGNNGTGNQDDIDALSLAEVEIMGHELNSYSQAYQTNVETALRNQSSSIYLRTEFTIVDNPATLSQLLLNVQYDDGFIAYLNGTQIASRNAPGSPTFNSTATTDRDKAAALATEAINVTAHLHLLVQGENVLAIHGLNASASDSDFLIVPELVGSTPFNAYSFFTTPTPGTSNNEGVIGFVADTIFNVDRGYFNTPFQLTITTATADAEIYTTSNGSAPTPTNGVLYTGPISVSATTTLRAAAFKAGYAPTNIDTQTYLFLADVLQQSPEGQTPMGWPTGSVNGQAFDYGMDPNIVNDVTWSAQLEDAFAQIPSLSIVTEQANLTDPTTGIYVNAHQDGRAWERPTSLELINPDGSTGFQVDSGLRIRGGFSRGSFNPKHSFRLFFRSEYGDSKLNYPMFGEEGVDQFDNIDLRTAQNYAWSNNTFNNETRNTFLRDIYSRDLQREMGQEAYTRGRYYHLYINGQYWGMYQTEERPNANFAESYFGGQDENYDAVKASGGVGATDGDLVAWTTLTNLANNGFSTDSAYYFAQGKNSDGSDNSSLEKHVDVDNLINFMINVYFTGNQDMPTNLGNSGPNNFWAVRPRDGSAGWRWIAHDNEHNLGSPTHGPLVDVTSFTSAGGSPSSFNPKFLHQQLTEHPEYVQRFADRVQAMFFNEGPLTTTNAQALLDARVTQIDSAIVAESARWGDQHNEPALSKTTWQAEVNWLRNTFLPQRNSTVLDQFRSHSWFPAAGLNAPAYNQHGGQVASGFDLSMSAPAGTVYYTLDGSDPRLAGGAVSPTALIYSGSTIDITAAITVNARALSGGDWSALNSADFIIATPANGSNLRITELNYNPHDANPTPGLNELNVDNDQFEFIELQNISGEAIDLVGVQFVEVPDGNDNEGIVFTFGQQTLEPGERVLIVKNQAAFESRYGLSQNIAGEYEGKLSNSGEQLTVKAATGTTIQTFEYYDGGSWPGRADGTGSSLEIDTAQGNIANLDYDNADNWRSSNEFGGTPGIDGTGPLRNIIVNEVLSHSDGLALDKIELYNSTNTPFNLNKWYLSDTKNNLYQFQFTANTPLGADQYLVLDQNQLGFALDGQHGDDLWLIEADPTTGKPLRFAEHVEFDATDTDVSLGRWSSGDPSGPLFPMTGQTLGSANDSASVGPVVADVAISEVHYNPADVPAGQTGNIDKNELEFLEIINTSDSARNISNWKTTGIKFTFPANTTLTVDEAIVIVTFDPALEPNKATAFRNIHGIGTSPRLFGPATGNLRDTGERVKLLRPEDPSTLLTGDVLVDAVRYDNGGAWPATAAGDSLHRNSENDFGNFETSWSAANSTPGSVSLTVPVSGDFDGDNDIDGADFLAWQRGFGKTGNATPVDGDANGDNNVDAADLNIWTNQYATFSSASTASTASTSFSTASFSTAGTPTSAALQVEVTNTDSVDVARSSIAALYANSRQTINNNARDTIFETPIFLLLRDVASLNIEAPSTPLHSSTPTDEALATFGDETTKTGAAANQDDALLPNELWSVWN